jgi:two-component system, NarL family, sensor kinase
MFKYIYNILLLFLAFGSAAQNTDSLRVVISAMPADTHRVWALRQLYLAHLNLNQTDAALAVSREGTALCRVLGFDKGLERHLFYEATALDILGHSGEAIGVFEAGLAVAERLRDRQGVADYHMNLGVAHYSLGRIDKALEHYLAAYGHYKRLGMRAELSKLLNNIGIVYRTQGKRDEAEVIYRESLALKIVLGDSVGMATAYQNLASLLCVTDRMQESLDYMQQAIDFHTRHNRPDDLAACQALAGRVYFNLNRFEAAETALQKARARFVQKPSPEYISSVFQLLGSLAIVRKNDVQAEAYLLEGLHWAQHFDQRDRQWDILEQLAATQQRLGKPAAAYTSMRAAYTLRDTLLQAQRMETVAEMQAKFEVAQKDNQLALQQLTLQQRTRERNWLLGAAVLFLLLSAAIFWGLRLRLRTNQKIGEQALELQQQLFQQREQEHKLEAFSVTLKAQEGERLRIANDLHDGLGSLLAAAKAHVSSLLTNPNHALYLKTNRMMDDACGEVRRIAHNLMPKALTTDGLASALSDLAHDLRAQGLDCDLECVGLDRKPPLNTERTALVYRMVQECCHNVVKHAGATHLLLQLILDAEQLLITIEDNGRGFDPTKVPTGKGLGLQSIKTRAQLLNGDILWDTAPGRGTLVSISVPMR